MSEIDFLAMYDDATTILTGEFPVVLAKVEAKQSQNGKPMLKCKVVIESGAYVGREMTHNFVFSGDNPTARRIFFKDLGALGLDRDFFAGQPTMDMIAQALVGKRATVQIREGKEFRGETREEFYGWSAPTGFAPVGAYTPPASSAVPDMSQIPSTSVPSTEPPADPF